MKPRANHYAVSAFTRDAGSPPDLAIRPPEKPFLPDNATVAQIAAIRSIHLTFAIAEGIVLVIFFVPGVRSLNRFNG